MTPLLFAVIILLAAAAQAALPPVGWLGGIRVEFLPAVVAVAALSAATPTRAILMAALAGVAQDAVSAAPFGLAAIGYVVPVVAVSGLRKSLDRDLPWVQAGAGGCVAALAGLAGAVVPGLTFGTFAKIVLLALLSAVFTPLLFLISGWLGPVAATLNAET